MQVCLLTAILVSSASADAGWLDRARGVGAGAQVYAQVSAFRSVKQNLGTLTGLFGDMLDAVGEGDDERVGEVWSDIRDVPGKIVRDAFPVLGLVESASAALDGARERLGAARARIERLVGKAGDIASLAPLAISREEQPFYEWTTGILDDEPLPEIAFAEAVGIERSRIVSGIEDHEDDVWREASAGSEITTGVSEARQRYDETLKGLDEILAASSGVKDQDGKPESGADYEASIEALDRRRAEYEAELREQAAAAPAVQKQETANSPARDTSVRLGDPTDEPRSAQPQIEANTRESSEPDDDRCRITCRQGSVCVEYTLDDPSDCAEFSAQCQNSPGVTFEHGHSCAPGLACRQRTPQRVSSTYDPSIDSGRFEEICVGNQGKIVRKSH